MIKRLILNSFRALGYELVKVDRAAPAAPGAASNGRGAVGAAELAKLRTDLESFFARVNGPASPNTSWRGYDAATMLGYLTPGRLAFYHEILACCAAKGLTLEGQCVADIGTYIGYFPRLVVHQMQNCCVVGFDVDARSLELARHLCPQAEFRQEDLLRQPEPFAGRFDAVFCTEVLEHVLDPEAALAALLRLLRRGATLVLTVPDGRRDQSEPGGLASGGIRYTGHINYWSPESWPRFLARHAPGPVETGLLSSGENYGMIRGE